MRIVIIGSTGHIGTYLVPRLVAAGHEVAAVSRNQRAPYQESATWQRVTCVQADRVAEERAGTFGSRIRDLQPDAVIDLICFTLDNARQLASSLRGEVQHFLHCGTIWVHGPSREVPTSEDEPRRPFGDYGILALGMAEDSFEGRSRRDMGSYRAQPQLQHCQSPEAARLPSSLQLAGSC